MSKLALDPFTPLDDNESYVYAWIFGIVLFMVAIGIVSLFICCLFFAWKSREINETPLKETRLRTVDGKLYQKVCYITKERCILQKGAIKRERCTLQFIV